MNIVRELRKEQARYLTRRWFLRDCGVGLAGIAASSLLANESSVANSRNPLTTRPPHFAPKAKRVLYLFNSGAPSQLELFDPKPELAKRDGTLPPADLLKGVSRGVHQPELRLTGTKILLRSPRKLRYGVERAASAYG